MKNNCDVSKISGSPQCPEMDRYSECEFSEIYHVNEKWSNRCIFRNYEFGECSRLAAIRAAIEAEKKEVGK